jgi:pimeloyl-ACP methyl ester carboxylesterase
MSSGRCVADSFPRGCLRGPVQRKGVDVGEGFGRLKKFLSYGAVVLALLIGSGVAYQEVRSAADRTAYPAPGEMISVDGLDLHLDCRGQGSPVVLLESGLTTGSTSWALVQDEIASFTRVCAYDRPGIDWSEPLEETAGPVEVAQRLHRLIDVAQMQGPWILVGMSAGGIYVREYFATYPEGVVGMVLVDSSHEEQGRRLPAEGEDPLELATPLAVCSYLQPLGLIRALGVVDETIEMFWQVDIPPAVEGPIKANANQSHACSALYYEMVSFQQALAQPRPPRSLGDLPLIVLSQGIEPYGAEELGVSLAEARAQRAAWDELQEELAGLSSVGERRIAEKSGHLIQIQQPEIVIEAIRDMVRAQREGLV